MKSEHIEVDSDGTNTFTRIHKLVEAGVTVRNPFARAHSRGISTWKTWFYRISYVATIAMYLTLIYFAVQWLMRLF